MSSQPLSQAAIPPTKASRLIPRNVYSSIFSSSDQPDLIELKLPSSLRIQPVAYDGSTYKIEDPILFKNDKGLMQERACAIENIIRWRYGQEGFEVTDEVIDGKMEIKSGEKQRVESNAKIVQWSDGTYSLAIGDEFFEISMESLTQRQCFSQYESFQMYKGMVKRKMIVKPPQKSQRSQRRFIKRINDA